MSLENKFLNVDVINFIRLLLWFSVHCTIILSILAYGTLNYAEIECSKLHPSMFENCIKEQWNGFLSPISISVAVVTGSMIAMFGASFLPITLEKKA